MEKIRIEWSGRAERDLQQIFNYLNSVTSERIALKVIGRIYAKANILERHPKAGPCEISLEAKPEGFRYLVEGNYKIVYFIEANTVVISFIFDCRQNPVVMESDLDR